MSEKTFVVRVDEQPGFVTTEAAYREFVRAARLRPMIATQLRRLREGADLVAVGSFIRTAYFDAEVPADVATALEQACADPDASGAELVVGSVVGDDQLDEFLTGPHELFVGVSGQRALLAAVKRCWASLFNDRAIIYREVRGIDHLSADLTIRIEPMTAASTNRTPELQDATRPQLQDAAAG
jgi:phosphoenolpyruvate synthase/pyruvate phosphate dikinase